jgi:hypothetical protein
VTDLTSVWSIGCTRPTTNTAEINGMAEGLELIDQRPVGNTYAILFDSMYAANVVEGNWTARTNLDAANKTAALLAEVRRRNDVRLIHVKGHSVHEYPGNDIADELAWWGKESPPFCRMRPRGGEGASRNGPTNYEARVGRRAEEKAAAARAAAAGEDVVAAARAAAAMGSAADAAEGGVGGATLGTGAAVDVASVGRGANENAVCDGVGQLSDPLEGY